MHLDELVVGEGVALSLAPYVLADTIKPRPDVFNGAGTCAAADARDAALELATTLRIIIAEWLGYDERYMISIATVSRGWRHIKGGLTRRLVHDNARVV